MKRGQCGCASDFVRFGLRRALLKLLCLLHACDFGMWGVGEARWDLLTRPRGIYCTCGLNDAALALLEKPM